MAVVQLWNVKTMIEAKIVAGSLNPFNDKKLVTFQLRYPRIVHAEMLTHSMLVRNSASSRAIPFNKKVEAVTNDPFIPIAYQRDHKGMQGTEYLDTLEVEVANNEWESAKDSAIDYAKYLNENGVTKQLCNRLLEPFEYIDVVISGTEWENFFELRCPKYQFNQDSVYSNGQKVYEDSKIYRSKKDMIAAQDADGQFYMKDYTSLEWLDGVIVKNLSQAEIHIQAIAEKMWDLYNEYDFKMLEPGEWHIPFEKDIVIPEDFQKRWLFMIPCPDEEKINVPHYLNQITPLVATAICARGSYGKFEGKSVEDDLKLHDRLLSEKHMSPFSHSAKCPTWDEYHKYSDTKYVGKDKPREIGWFSQFHGFMSYRYQLERNLI